MEDKAKIFQDLSEQANAGEDEEISKKSKTKKSKDIVTIGIANTRSRRFHG